MISTSGCPSLGCSRVGFPEASGMRGRVCLGGQWRTGVVFPPPKGDCAQSLMSGRGSLELVPLPSPRQVQTLHLLLCRSFQLCYLLMHPEEQDWPPSGPTPREPWKLPGSLPESRVVWESLNPEDISQNVNALVSFRRLPCPADFGSSVSVVRVFLHDFHK